MDGDAAATWGVLNEVRRLREETYREYFAWHQSQHGQPAVTTGIIMLLLGSLSLAGLLAVSYAQGWPPDATTWVIFAFVVAVCPGLLLVGGAAFVLKNRRHRHLVERYDARQEGRDEWQLVLDGLAGRWSGQVETDGVGPASRFLIKHWPDHSPQLIVGLISGDSGDRLTLTGVAHGHPVLVHVTDLHEPGGDFTPPVLVVLVACPLDPDGARLKPGETDAGRWLAGKGFWIGWTRAGAFASHGGPADSLLNRADLDQVVSTVALLCAEAPAGAEVARPEPVRRGRSGTPKQVAEEFLRALSAGDALGALACGDSDLAAGRLFELCPQDVLDAVAMDTARPVEWRWFGMTGSSTAEIHRFHMTHAGRPSKDVQVHLNLRQDGWRVCGYKAGLDLLLGIEHEDSG